MNTLNHIHEPVFQVIKGKWGAQKCKGKARAWHKVLLLDGTGDLVEAVSDTTLLVLGDVGPELVLILHEISKDGTTEEDHVLTTRGILNAALELVNDGLVALGDLLGVEGADVLLETRGETGVHGGTSRENNVLVELRTDIHVSAVDSVEDGLRDTNSIDIDETGGEEGLGSHVALTADLDDATVGEGVRLDQNGGIGRETVLQINVITDVAELLLHLTDSLEVSGTVEGISAVEEELDKVLGDIASSNVDTLGQVGQTNSLVDGNDVRDSISRIEDDSVHETLGIKGQDGLDGNVDRLEAVLLEHDLQHLLAVLTRVQRGLSQQDLRVAGVDAQLLRESVVPDVVHVLEVLDNSVLQGVADLQHLAQLGGLISDHDVLEAIKSKNGDTPKMKS